MSMADEKSVEWENGAITDAALDQMRSWLNKPRPVPHWNSEVTKDNIWHFALGVGDDNPLWWDEDYAKASSRGAITPSPTYLYSHTNGPRLKPEHGRASTEFLLPGVLGLWAGERWKWHRQVRLGEKIHATTELVEVTVNEGGQFGGRSVTQVERMPLVTDTGETVAEIWHTIKRFERAATRSKSTYLERSLAKYTEADRQRFEQHYLTEAKNLRRGAEPRYIEDVRPGETIGPMLKGPLTVNNIIGFLLGWGSGLNAANRMAYTLLNLHPGIRMVHPDSGVTDNYESPHWDAAYARLSGLPDGYDFGSQRFSWFAHLLTDWMGDQGELVDLEFRLLKPNIINDVTWLNGEIARIDEDAGTVVIDITATNQLDQVTARGRGTVKLPNKAR